MVDNLTAKIKLLGNNFSFYWFGDQGMCEEETMPHFRFPSVSPLWRGPHFNNLLGISKIEFRPYKRKEKPLNNSIGYGT